jgi:predicted peptidase
VKAMSGMRARMPARWGVTRLALLVAALSACTSEPVQPQIEVDSVVTRRPAGKYYLTQVYPAGGIVRYTLYVPAGIDAPNAKVPLVIAAHFGGTVTPWLGGDYADLLVMPALSSLDAVVIAPDAGTANGWSEADEARVMWLAREVQARYPIDPARVLMTGYSAGGAQTWLIANRNQDFFTAVIPMSARPRQNPVPWRIPVNVIHSSADELTPIATVQTYVSDQQAAGARMQLQLVNGVSHYQTAAFVPHLKDAIPWLRGVWP